MGIRLQNFSRPRFICISLAAMLTGLFFSRVLISVGLVLFVLSTFQYGKVHEQFKTFTNNPLLVCMALLFALPLISGLWSQDIKEWWSFVRIKVPLALLPFAFAGSWKLRPLEWKMLFVLFLCLIIAGCGWSIASYFANTASMNRSYLRAGLIPTPFEDDHVRFSWMVALALLLVTFCFQLKLKSWEKIALITVAALLVFYLHLLSARTGLACLYLLSLGIIVYCLSRFRRRPWAVLCASFLLLLPLLAWCLLPTFRNRLSYNRYDYSYYSKGAYLPGSSDGTRVASLRAGWQTLMRHPLGTGFGQIRAETNAWYFRNIPSMPDCNKIYPSNEWLLYGAGSGWPGFLLVTALCFYPIFLMDTVHRPVWLLLNLFACIAFLSDIPLETQIGVYCYTLPLLCWWKYDRKQCAKEFENLKINHRLRRSA